MSSSLPLVLQSSETRRGKWIEEEEAYTSRIILDFHKGLLDISSGITLRQYLSQELNCDPMRITKKFARVQTIGKCAYVPLSRTPENSKIIDEAQNDVSRLRSLWHSKLQQQDRDLIRKRMRSEKNISELQVQSPDGLTSLEEMTKGEEKISEALKDFLADNEMVSLLSWLRRSTSALKSSSIQSDEIDTFVRHGENLIEHIKKQIIEYYVQDSGDDGGFDETSNCCSKLHQQRNPNKAALLSSAKAVGKTKIGLVASTSSSGKGKWGPWSRLPNNPLVVPPFSTADHSNPQQLFNMTGSQYPQFPGATVGMGMRILPISPFPMQAYAPHQLMPGPPFPLSNNSSQAVDLFAHTKSHVSGGCEGNRNDKDDAKVTGDNPFKNSAMATESPTLMQEMPPSQQARFHPQQYPRGVQATPNPHLHAPYFPSPQMPLFFQKEQDQHLLLQQALYSQTVLSRHAHSQGHSQIRSNEAVKHVVQNHHSTTIQADKLLHQQFPGYFMPNSLPLIPSSNPGYLPPMMTQADMSAHSQPFSQQQHVQHPFVRGGGVYPHMYHPPVLPCSSSTGSDREVIPAQAVMATTATVKRSHSSARDPEERGGSVREKSDPSRKRYKPDSSSNGGKSRGLLVSDRESFSDFSDSRGRQSGTTSSDNTLSASSSSSCSCDGSESSAAEGGRSEDEEGDRDDDHDDEDNCQHIIDDKKQKSDLPDVLRSESRADATATSREVTVGHDVLEALLGLQGLSAGSCCSSTMSSIVM